MAAQAPCLILPDQNCAEQPLRLPRVMRQIPMPNWRCQRTRSSQSPLTRAVRQPQLQEPTRQSYLAKATPQDRLAATTCSRLYADHPAAAPARPASESCGCTRWRSTRSGFRSARRTVRRSRRASETMRLSSCFAPAAQSMR